MLVMGGGLLGFTGRAAVAEDPTAGAGAAPTNSYAGITARNAFGIRAPTPPPALAPVAQVAPPNLFLTGMTLVGGVKRAYLIVEKVGGKQPEYLSVEEGYDRDSLEVLEIDPRRQSVRVRQVGNEVTLNFKNPGRKPVAAPAAGYGGTQPPAVAAAVAAPTIIGHGGGVRDDAGTAPGVVPQPASGTSPAPTPASSALRRGAGNSGSGNPQRPVAPVPPVPTLPGR